MLAAICLIGWIALKVLHLGADLYLRNFRLDAPDNLLARKHLTQVRVLVRVLDTIIVLVTLGFALMTFDAVRQYGISLFASAGVAGVVFGLAAQPVLSNLIAGIQMPLRWWRGTRSPKPGFIKSFKLFKQRSSERGLQGPRWTPSTGTLRFAPGAQHDL